MHTWELTLARASEQRIPVIVIIPGPTHDPRTVIDDLLRRFRLDAALAGFLFADATGGRSGKTGWPARDAMIARQVNVLLPVSIRPGGTLDRILMDYPDKIHDPFIIPYQKSSRPRPTYDCATVNPAFGDEKWLIHFTRSVPGPWPDETEYDYYRAVCRSGGAYCRSASATLSHILTTGTIFGSSRHIRHGGPVVGFTSFSSHECRNLFRYRPRLVNPYFEPYGIAILCEAAAGLGLRPVLYGTPGQYTDLADAEKPYFQNIGSDGARWKGEREWRYPGDFRLSLIPSEAGRVIVPTASECGYPRVRPNFACWPLFV